MNLMSDSQGVPGGAGEPSSPTATSLHPQVPLQEGVLRPIGPSYQMDYLQRGGVNRGSS